MSWVLFSVLAAFIWAIVNTIDKYVLTKWVKKPIVPVMVLGILSVFAAFLVYLLKGFSYFSLINIMLAFIAGTFYMVGTIFYFKAIKIEEVSRVVPLFHLIPFFVLILATIFLGEIFTPIMYLGILLLIVGAFLISTKNFKKISFGLSFRLMMLSVLCFSINLLLGKYLLGFADYWTVFSYIRIGSILVLIPIFILNYKDLISVVKKHGKKTIGVMSIAETLNLVAILLYVIALSSGYLTLVSALGSVQAFFLLLLTVILSIFFPKILKEEISRKTILIKLLAIIILFIGALLIT